MKGHDIWELLEQKKEKGMESWQLLNVGDGYIGIHYTVRSHVKFHNKKFWKKHMISIYSDCPLEHNHHPLILFKINSFKAGTRSELLWRNRLAFFHFQNSLKILKDRASLCHWEIFQLITAFLRGEINNRSIIIIACCVLGHPF